MQDQSLQRLALHSAFSPDAGSVVKSTQPLDVSQYSTRQPYS